MYRRAPWLVILTIVLVAGCGGDDTEQPAKAKATATATPAGAELREHMLAKDDLPGASPGNPLHVTEPEAWVLPSGHKDADEVRASGFVEGMEQRYDIAAINQAARFETPEQAEAEVAFVPPTPPEEKIETTEFEVPGVPGAIGRKTTSDLHANGYNIAFTTGEYFHLVAAKASDVSKAELIAATKRLYDRVK